MMTVDDAMSHLDVVLEHEPLNALHEEIFRQAWQGKTYEQIATLHNYDTDYVRHIGQQLWKRLSRQMAQRVTKNNVQVIFRRHYQHYKAPIQSLAQNPHQGNQDMEHVSLNGFSLDSTTSKTQGVDHPSINPSNCLERYGSLRTLQQWIERDRAKLIAILGVGGIGKTTLAQQLVQTVQDHFEVVLWRSLRNSPPFQTFISDLIAACPGIQMPLDTTDSQISTLLTYFRERRCLLILDNFESILQPHTINGYYQPDHAPYGQLLRSLADHMHQSCAILTSREVPVGIEIRVGLNSPVQVLPLRGLSAIAAQSIMATHHIQLSDQEAETLRKTYAGNPYLLKLVSITIRDLFQGNVHHWLTHGKFVYGKIYRLLGQQIERLAPSEYSILCCFAQDSAPMDMIQLQSVLSQQMSPIEVIESLQSLLGRSLLESKTDGFHLHGALRQYLQSKCD